jgi:CheY-like chemotaxis protein
MARILIIDDDAGVRGVLTVMLQRAGHEVMACASGADGIARARENRPDLVLLDIEMPGMNGFDVCSLIKTDTSLRDVAVIIMTGRPLAGIPARAQSVGAVTMIAKPFERERLLETIGLYVPGAKPNP